MASGAPACPISANFYAYRDICDIMTYHKAWLKCLNKIQNYTSVPATDWNHYQLLGYLISNTNERFEPIDLERINPDFLGVHKTEPNSHPMLECMRYIYRQCNKNAQQTKTFLDWCLSKYGAKLNTKGLRHLLEKYRLQEQLTTSCIPDRTDPLPNNLQSLFSDLHCHSYGDLAQLRNDDELNSILIIRLQTINLTIQHLYLDKIS